MLKTTFPAFKLFAAAALLSLLTGCSTLGSWFSPLWEDNPQTETASSWQLFAESLKPLAPATDHYRTGRSYSRQKKFRLAVEEYKKALRIQPEHIDALNAMGVACDQLGRYESAEMAYKAALELDAKRADVLNNLGYCYLMQDKIQAAIDTFQQAIALDDSSPLFKNNLGLAYAKNGEYNLAFAQLRQSNTSEKAFAKLKRVVSLFGLSKQFAQHQLPSLPQQRLTCRRHPPNITNTADTNRRVQLTALRKNILDEGQPGFYLVPKIIIAQTPAPKTQTQDSLLKPANREEMERSISWYTNQSATAEIEVSNGNGVYRMAHQVGEFLKQRSFPVTRLTNAENFHFTTSTIFYCRGYIKSAFELAKQIPGDQEVDEVRVLGRPNIKLRLLLGRDLTDKLALFKQTKLAAETDSLPTDHTDKHG